MKSGQCPKCNSNEIYASLGSGGIGEGFSIRVLYEESMSPTREWQTYLCASCGYFENYLLDEAKIARIVEDPQKAGWKKIT